MEADDNEEGGIFPSHFLDLSCSEDEEASDEGGNSSVNENSVSGDLLLQPLDHKNNYDFSYVQEDLSTTDALGYLAIDKYVLGLIMDAKTAAKTAKAAAHKENMNSADDGGQYDDKTQWAGRHRKDKEYALSHKNEIKPTVPCLNAGCSFKSSNTIRLQHHMKHCLIDEAEKPYACPECGHRSSIDKDHYDHLMLHVIQTPFKCFYCDKICTTKGYFRDHFVSEHKSAKSFTCSICGFQSTKRNCLQSHMASHVSKKTEKCNVCGAKFKDYVGLKIHMHTHTGNPWKVKRNFSCNLCGQKYKQQAALQRHLYSHKQSESINPLKCSMCLFSCKQGAKLQRHMINCHPESLSANSHPDSSVENRPYACTVCQLRFIRAADLQQHMRTHLQMQSVEQVDSSILQI